MPRTQARANAKLKGYCVNCFSPRSDRTPTHGNRCEVCWHKHQQEKADNRRIGRGQGVRYGHVAWGGQISGKLE